MRARGSIKEGLELTLMSSFDIEQGGINSGPGSHGIPEWVRADGAGFSLCAVPLESSGPGFCRGGLAWVNERRSGGVPDQRWWRGLGVRGGVKVCNIMVRGS